MTKKVRLIHFRRTQLTIRRELDCRQSVRRWMVLFQVAILLLAQLGAQGQAQKKASRLITLDDLFNVRGIARYWGGSVDFSPDGSQLAFAIERPLKDAKLYTDVSLDQNARADVYVAKTTDGQPSKITDGAADKSSWFAPHWSPDGKRLAILSNRGDSINVWVWERETGSLRQATDGSVDMFAAEECPYTWLSPTRLLVSMLPPGEQSLLTVGLILDAERAAAKRIKAWKGEELSASVLSSGVKPDLTKRPQGSLIDVDIERGKSRVMVKGTARNISVSPDGSAVAYLRQTEIFQPQSDAILPMNDLFKNRAGKFKLEAVSTDGTFLLTKDAQVDNVMPASLRWSPDGQELAFLAYVNGRDHVARLSRFLRASGSLRVSQADNIDAAPLPKPGGTTNRPQLEWTKQGWIVYGTQHAGASPSGVQDRRDWWLVEEGNTLQSITAGMEMPPAELWPSADGKSFVGLANGNLWRIGIGIKPQNLTAEAKKRITGVLWPQNAWASGYSAMPSKRVYTQIVVGTEQEVFAFDFASSNMTAISPPAPGAAVAAFSPSNRAILYQAADGTGLHLWLSPAPQQAAKMIYEANTFLQDIMLGIDKKISYRSLEGQDLGGWLLLPPDYKPGQRYPLIVWVYLNWVAGQRPDQVNTNVQASAPSVNMQIAAARGYAVLMPSIPLNRYGEVDDPLLKLTSGVLPAVDKVIEMGIADPERLFAMGQSNGGYAVYGLITQTNRFKAAVVKCGYSNIVSGYSQFAGYRYHPYAHEVLTATQQPNLETVYHLGGSPWKDYARYQRNNPIAYVDRVRTPLLLMVGDMDGMPMEQAEEFFMGLYRQGKRAELVRYWGEGHVIVSPPNVYDMWDRIFVWFDEFSKPAKSTQRGD